MLPDYCKGCGRIYDGEYKGCGKILIGQCVGWLDPSGCGGKYYVTPEEFAESERKREEFLEEKYGRSAIS